METNILFLAAASKYIVFVGIVIVLCMVVYGYYLDIKKRDGRE